MLKESILWRVCRLGAEKAAMLRSCLHTPALRGRRRLSFSFAQDLSFAAAERNGPCLSKLPLTREALTLSRESWQLFHPVISTRGFASVSSEEIIADPQEWQAMATPPHSILDGEKEEIAPPPAIDDPSSSRSDKMKASQVDLKTFLERTQYIVTILSLLKEQWTDETPSKLTKLKLTYNSAIVTQVLRRMGEKVKYAKDAHAVHAAMEFFHWLKGQHGYKHDEFTYGVMLNVLGKAGRIDEMLALYEEIRTQGCPLTMVTRARVMFWLGRARKIDEVLSLWQQIEEEGVKPSVSVYTIMLDALATAKEYQQVQKLYIRMLKEDCLPNARTHTVLIEHLVDAGKLDEAFKILSIIENMKVVPNNVIFETLIEAYAKNKNIEMVLKLVVAMKEHFLKPGPRLAVAVQALMEAGREEEANMLAKDIGPELEWLKDSRIAGEVETECTNVEEDDCDSDVSDIWREDGGLNAGLDLNAFALALRNWEPNMLQQANIKWSSVIVYGILRRLRDTDAAHAFFNFLRDQAGFKHDSYSCMLMMQRIIKGKSNSVLKGSLMKELLFETHREGLLCVNIVNVVIRYYARLGQIEEALEMFNLMKQFELEPNEASYTAIITGLARDRQGKKAMELFEEMKKANMKPACQVYTELIKCLGLAGKYESAQSVFDRRIESGIQPSGDEYMVIISMHHRLGNHKMALLLYEKMRNVGIMPSQAADSYEVVRAILQRANREKDLQTLTKRRDRLNFFQGTNKRLQESLLSVISIFSSNFKQAQPAIEGQL